MRHRDLAIGYRQIATYMDAGQSFPDALLNTDLGKPSMRQLMASSIEARGSVAGGLSDTPGILPRQDVLFLQLASKTGQLPGIAKYLAQIHERAAEHSGKVKGALTYPLLLAHAFAILGPTAGQFDFTGQSQGFDTVRWLTELATTLALVWGAIGLFVFLRSRFPDQLRAFVGMLPGFRKWHKNQGIAELAGSLCMTLRAGIRIDEAWLQSARLVDEPSLRSLAKTVHQLCLDGGSPSLFIKERPELPADFKSLYASGEKTGHLEDSLEKLAELYQQRAQDCLRLALALYPGLLALAIAASAVVSIFQTYSQYLSVFD